MFVRLNGGLKSNIYQHFDSVEQCIISQGLTGLHFVTIKKQQQREHMLNIENKGCK